MTSHALARPGPRADSRREQILRAVLAAISEDGFDHLSMRGVAERAGVPLGSLHYYFNSKDEIIAAALARSVEGLAEGIIGETDPVASPLDRLRQLAEVTVPALCADPATIPVYIGFWSWCQRDPARRELYHAIAVGLRGRVVALLDEGRRRGDFGVEDSAAAATVVVSALLGFLLDHHGDPGGVAEAEIARLRRGLEVAVGARLVYPRTAD